MNWYLTSQNSDLFNNIYKLLVGSYNNLGQDYYNSTLNDILGSMIDLSILDSTIYQASMSALKTLNIGSLTSEMRNAINDILLGFKSSNIRTEEPYQPTEENVMEEGDADKLVETEGV